MRMRVIGAVLSVLLCMLCSVTVAASDYMLLCEPQTRVLSDAGDFSYTDEGAMVVSATQASGVTAAIDLNLTTNLYENPFVQLSLSSDTAFNVAFKLNSDSLDCFPQTAAPAWYEGFQTEAPTAGGGIHAGAYTLSLSIPAYLEYNGLTCPTDGVVTLETVYIILKGAGTLTLEHLILSDKSDFQTAFGKTGQTAFSPIAITTGKKGSLPTTVPTYDAGGVMRYQSDRTPIGVILLLIVAATAIALTLCWKRIPWKAIKKRVIR